MGNDTKSLLAACQVKGVPISYVKVVGNLLGRITPNEEPTCRTLRACVSDALLRF